MNNSGDFIWMPDGGDLVTRVQRTAAVTLQMFRVHKAESEIWARERAW